MTKGRKYHEQASRPRNIGNRTIIHKKRPPSDESGRIVFGQRQTTYFALVGKVSILSSSAAEL